jgi:hypothetical protein
MHYELIKHTAIQYISLCLIVIVQNLFKKEGAHLCLNYVLRGLL